MIRREPPEVHELILPFVVTCKPGFDARLAQVQAYVDDRQELIDVLLWHLGLPDDSEYKVTYETALQNVVDSSGQIKSDIPSNWVNDRLFSLVAFNWNKFNGVAQ